MVLGAWWLIIGIGALWRRTVWREGGAGIRSVVEARGGELRASWSGYELRGQGLRVRWRGGLRGAATVVRTADGTRSRVSGWLDQQGVQALLERPRSSG